MTTASTSASTVAQEVSKAFHCRLPYILHHPSNWRIRVDDLETNTSLPVPHNASKLIYALKPRQPVKAVLDFVQIAQRTLAREWAAQIERALRTG